METIERAIAAQREIERCDPNEIKRLAARHPAVQARQQAFREALRFGLTQEELASIVGLDQSRISRIVR